MNTSLSICSLLLLACGAVAQPATAQAAQGTAVNETAAQEQVAQDQVAQVTVTGVRDPEWTSYRHMHKAMDAFDKFRAYAPAATLRFVLRPVGRKVSMRDVSLQVMGRDASLALDLAPDGSFSLPRLPWALEQDAQLLLNVKKGQMRWRPRVRTASVPEGMLRLGDLRLECEVTWAAEEGQLPFTTRSFIRLLGGACASAKVPFHYPAGTRIEAATIAFGAKQFKLPVLSTGLGFVAPVHDRTFGDDALISFDGADGASTAAPGTEPVAPTPARHPSGEPHR